MNYSLDFILYFYLCLLLAFIVASLVLSSIIWAIQKLLAKFFPRLNTLHTSKKNVIFLGFGMTFLFVFCYFMVTEIISGQLWQHRQNVCAREVGYSRPGDDNSNKATSDSQYQFRECLKRLEKDSFF